MAAATNLILLKAVEYIPHKKRGFIGENSCLRFVYKYET